MATTPKAPICQCKYMCHAMDPHKTIKTEQGDIDERIAPLVALLNKAGVETTWSCEGGWGKLACAKCGREEKELVPAYIAFSAFEQVNWLIGKLASNAEFRKKHFYIWIDGMKINWIPRNGSKVLMEQITWEFPSVQIEEFTEQIGTILSN